MNCAECYQPIRPAEARDGIEQHDGRYEYEYVHEDGNPFCPVTSVARPPSPAGRLTDDDRFLISRAREVAPPLRGGGVREQLAAQLLDRLAGLAVRLGGEGGRIPPCPRCGTTAPHVAETGPGAWQCGGCGHEWEAGDG